MLRSRPPPPAIPSSIACVISSANCGPAVPDLLYWLRRNRLPRAIKSQATARQHSRTLTPAKSSGPAESVILFSEGEALFGAERFLSSSPPPASTNGVHVKPALRNRVLPEFYSAVFLSLCLVLGMTGCNSGSSTP